MKKGWSILLCVVMLFAAVACSGSGASAKTGTQPISVNDVLAAGMAEADGKTAESGPSTATAETGVQPADKKTSEPKQDTKNLNVDVDLTALSSTMVYSEVYNMVCSPEDYLGKIVKMDGAFAYYHDEATDNYYFACIIQDATACCAQGIEFVLTDDYSYPADYPEAGDEICVVGTFDTYMEGEYTYCTLRNAKLL
ncbi:MAG: hypothetical protein IJP98_05445 [Clostridia bacterium]|nr:hypothetical protein [Clostridia bacterium]